jgi:putative transposase
MKEVSTRETKESMPEYAYLEDWVRLKVQGFIQGILEEEVESLLGRSRYERREGVDAAKGWRNGYGKPRRMSLKTGTVTVSRPRVRGLEQRFESRILPLFRRRTKEIGDLLPELYLHGLALGDFELALRGLLGEGAPLSAASIQRLKTKWEAEYEDWRDEDLSDLEPVYFWADGVHVKAGLGKDKAALLVIVAAMRDGSKKVLSVESGYRESTTSWAAVLRSLKRRGFRSPLLVIADGNLGLWGALADVWPEVREQRCWNHKITNVLDCFPKRVQPVASQYLREIPYAQTRGECERLKQQFTQRYEADYPKAVKTLERDWDRMIAFYDFPAEHWRHIRTTNVVESPFSAVRLRTGAARRFKKVANATALIWKVLMVTEKRFRKLNAPHLLSELYQGIEYKDGKRVSDQDGRAAA